MLFSWADTGSWESVATNDKVKKRIVPHLTLGLKANRIVVCCSKFWPRGCVGGMGSGREWMIKPTYRIDQTCSGTESVIFVAHRLVLKKSDIGCHFL